MPLIASLICPLIPVVFKVAWNGIFISRPFFSLDAMSSTFPSMGFKAAVKVIFSLAANPRSVSASVFTSSIASFLSSPVGYLMSFDLVCCSNCCLRLSACCCIFSLMPVTSSVAFFPLTFLTPLVLSVILPISRGILTTGIFSFSIAEVSWDCSSPAFNLAVISIDGAASFSLAISCLSCLTLSGMTTLFLLVFVRLSPNRRSASLLACMPSSVIFPVASLMACLVLMPVPPKVIGIATFMERTVSKNLLICSVAGVTSAVSLIIRSLEPNCSRASLRALTFSTALPTLLVFVANCSAVPVETAG